MPHPWEAEKTIEPPEALRLIQEQFPELKAKHIRHLASGWDNTALVIDEELIFRFPRREVALPLLEAESVLLPRLAPRLPVPIPVPKWKGSPTKSFPWPFLGYRMLPGYTACYVNLTEEQRTSLAEPIAQFLAKLHAAPKELMEGCHIFGDNRSRIDSAILTEKIHKNFEELASLGLIKNRKALAKLHYRQPVETCLVHGDFYVRHLLVDQRHRLAGVIDWGDIHWGDPAIDLAIAHSFLPVTAHAAFRRAYGEISEETWALAKLRAIYSCSLLALYGHHSGDPDLLREGMRYIENL